MIYPLDGMGALYRDEGALSVLRKLTRTYVLSVSRAPAEQVALLSDRRCMGQVCEAVCTRCEC